LTSFESRLSRLNKEIRHDFLADTFCIVLSFGIGLNGMVFPSMPKWSNNFAFLKIVNHSI